MKAIVMEGPRKSKVADIDVPKIKDDELLIKVKYTGMCHSEWYPWTIANPGNRHGHEPMGIVADMGKDVVGFKIGDRVTGLSNGYAEYIPMDYKAACLIPDNIADEDAVAEPLSCILSAAARVPIETPGDTVAVVGAGYMGLGLISLLKARGAGKIIAVDIREEARENAKKFGADEVYSPETVPSDYMLTGKNWGEIWNGVDIFKLGMNSVVEFTGEESGLRFAGDMVTAHGFLGVGGYHNDCDRTVNFQMWNQKAIIINNLHERRRDYQIKCCKQSLDLISKGLWKYTGVSRHIYSMDEYDRAYEDMINKPAGYIKALVRCDS